MEQEGFNTNVATVFKHITFGACDSGWDAVGSLVTWFARIEVERHAASYRVAADKASGKCCVHHFTGGGNKMAPCCCPAGNSLHLMALGLRLSIYVSLLG
ncbi:hypothetical protein Q8A73_007529 [Channa argus]|nr:hypothetical protein Q8A73_007529 [Channa argus]